MGYRAWALEATSVSCKPRSPVGLGVIGHLTPKNSSAAPTPNFFVVGAAKAGTTSLVRYIGQHPDVFVPAVKEPFFFVTDFSSLRFTEYLELFANSRGAKAIGEGSTGYLFDENAPRRIRTHFPGAKIIIMLRNPVDTAYSLWRYIRATSDEDKSFQEAISDKERAYRNSEAFREICKNWWANYLYLERAEFHIQVKRYLDTFGADAVRVFFFERFIREPEQICRDIYSYLDIDPDFSTDCSRILNEGGEARFRLLRWLGNRRYPLLRAALPPPVRFRVRAAMQTFNLRPAKRLPLDRATRVRLEDHFRPSVHNLKRLLAIEIPEWGELASE